MKVARQERAPKGIRFSIDADGREVARAYLHIAAARELGCYKLIATSRASRQ